MRRLRTCIGGLPWEPRACGAQARGGPQNLAGWYGVCGQTCLLACDAVPIIASGRCRLGTNTAPAD